MLLSLLQRGRFLSRISIFLVSYSLTFLLFSCLRRSFTFFLSYFLICSLYSLTFLHFYSLIVSYFLTYLLIVLLSYFDFVVVSYFLSLLRRVTWDVPLISAERQALFLPGLHFATPYVYVTVEMKHGAE